MELLQSKKFRLPPLYFVTDRKEIKNIPKGIPFIYGNPEDKRYIIRLLEYEVIWKKTKESGMPFNFKKLLREAGFTDIIALGHCPTVYIDYADSDTLDFDVEDDWDEFTEENILERANYSFQEYIKDATAYVDLKKLKNLKVFPVWLNTIEEAVKVNIQNFALFNYNMYNKKLEGMYGALQFAEPKKNLIICDISNSIPKAVATTTLLMSRNMGESFYADVMVTGRITILIPYEELHTMDIDKIYEEVGMNNEQTYFKKLVTSERRVYGTCICFGDNNHPGDTWGHKEDRYYSDADGKKMCLWEVDRIISFHTDNNYELAGYARWFTAKEITYIKDWVKYLND